ncbi:MAG: hypothetical protein HY825_15135 [Acidobacteria bacterium]|nr:hypothetical protein [Acidobacteriota bacterium]
MNRRLSNIDAILDRSRRDLTEVMNRFKASLAAKHIDPDLRIDIKNLCGNLRSVLDYLAQDIRAKHCPDAESHTRFYFPVLPTLDNFQDKMAAWFPGLAVACPDLWTYLESVQPYHQGFEWLGQLNRVNIENKHGDLLEQTRVESERVTVTGPAGGQVSWNPRAVKFGPGVFIGGVPVNPRTQLPVPHPSQTVERVVWVDFQFGGLGVSAPKLLSEAVTGITAIAASVRKWLE